MRIVIDLDGTIATLRKHNQDYSEVVPLPGAVEKLTELKKAGHHLIIYSARHMKTCEGDVALVEQKIGKKTRDWLNKFNIPYDELIFGKPYGHMYIDDLAIPFRGWQTIQSSQLDTETINVVIPMAGLGSRFVKAGFTTPKPLIDVLGQPMIKWAIDSLSFLPQESMQLIFIILEEHEVQYNLSQQLRTLFGDSIHVIQAQHVTRGQADTVYLAKDVINNWNKLFIFNCDTYSKTPDLWTHITEINPDGALACFTAQDPRYSYAQLDTYGYVQATAEKKVLSNNASTGLYYFKHGFYFIDEVEKALNSYHPDQGEIYVAPLYNELIKLGKKVTISNASENWILGTPEELEYFVTNYQK
jgi:capsule biosynthesis phosphatase